MILTTFIVAFLPDFQIQTAISGFLLARITISNYFAGPVLLPIFPSDAVLKFQIKNLSQAYYSWYYSNGLETKGKLQL